MNGAKRDKNGLFVKGTAGGPGYPTGKARDELQRALLGTVKPKDVKRIAARLIEMAMGEVVEIEVDPETGERKKRPIDDKDAIRAAKLVLDKVLPPMEKTLNIKGEVKHDHDVRPLVQAVQNDPQARAAMLVVRDRMRELAPERKLMRLIDQLDPRSLSEIAHRLDPSDFGAHAGLQSLGGPFRRTRLSDYLGGIIADAVSRGGARIIVNVGTRQGKSELCCFATPTWYLDTFPDRRIILGTSTSTLATTFASRVRDEFQTNPNLYTTLRDDSQRKDMWNTDEGGGMMAVGSEKAVQGFGFNLGIVDDLHRGWVEARSAVQRKADISWFTGSFMSRAEPGASVVVLGARMHRDDLTGHLMRTGEHGPWKLIKLSTFARSGDPMGRAQGELVCPERWSMAEMVAKRNATPKEQWAAIHEQDPQACGEGRVYGSYSDENLKNVTLNPSLPLFAAFDFNVNPGVSILIGQHYPPVDRIGVRHEVWGSRRKVAEATRLAISRLTESTGGRFVWPKLTVYGDRSGRTENSQTVVTDYQVIAQVLKQTNVPFEFRIPDANPPVKLRTDSMNEALCDNRGERHLFIDPHCRESESKAALVDDLEQMQTDEDGQPDKGDTDLSHAADAMGYAVYRLRPVGGPVKTTGGMCYAPPPRK